MECEACAREKAVNENPGKMFSLIALVHTCNQPERSKREDSIPNEAAKEFKQFLDETFDRRMGIVMQLQKERDAVL